MCSNKFLNFISSKCTGLPRAVHIVCFDIPYPANYGGAIDVFHKVRWLHQKGVEVYLHCFEYGGRVPSTALEQYCRQVFYYKRHTGLMSLLSAWPYNVRSRYSEALLENLSRDDHPIICEVLHTCYVLADERFSHRLKIYREVNIEHDYYRHLALGEKNILKKIYLRLEAAKLRRFEPVVLKADQVAVVSAADQDYFRQRYPSLRTALVPCFHEFDEVKINEGQSDYILYHGNLGVSENYMAAEWLIDHVFSQLAYKVVIAGLNPPAFLKEKIARYAHITLKENCSSQDMTQLIGQAQVHALYTGQATGLKLKLLNVLYRGRFVVANTAMLSGTSLHAACTVADTPVSYIKAIDELMQMPFTVAAAEKRKQLVKAYDNAEKITTLLGMMPL